MTYFKCGRDSHDPSSFSVRGSGASGRGLMAVRRVREQFNLLLVEEEAGALPGRVGGGMFSTKVLRSEERAAEGEEV